MSSRELEKSVYTWKGTDALFIVFLREIHVLNCTLRNGEGGGAWVVQLAKCLTLGFGSGRDLKVERSSPAMGSTLSRESA